MIVPLLRSWAHGLLMVPRIARCSSWWLAVLLISPPGGVPRAGAQELGFFGVRWRDDKAWLISPRREPFLSMGINHIGDHSYRIGDVLFYDPVRRQHGGDKAAWIRSVRGRLERWGFNTIGAWSDADLHRVKVPYVRMLYVARGSDWDAVLDRVFDPRFESLVAGKAAEAATFRNDRHLIGYFLDNELPWWGEYGWKAAGQKSLLEKYAAYDRRDASKRALVRFLKARHGDDIRSFNAVWQTSFSSFDQLLAPLPLKPRTRRQKETHDAWAGEVAERFFSVTTSAVRKADPNHLILGVRFAGVQIRQVVEACGRHVDVVSVNHYSKSGQLDVELLDNFYVDSRRPVLITEYSYRAMENRSGNPNTRGADVTVPTQADRAERAGRYVTQALELPYVVGLHWFEWADQPPAGRFDGEDNNYGLVDILDREYEQLTRAHARLNRRARRLHREGKARLPEARHENPPPSYRKARAGARMPPVRGYWKLPNPASSVWSDVEKGGDMKVTGSGKTVALEFRSGTGWGCGASFPPGQGPLLKGGNIDVTGYHYLELEALVPGGVELSVFLTESGSGPHGQERYEGVGGADGESYELPSVSGTGRWTRHRLPLADLERRAGWGNQSGNHVLDLQGLARIDLFVAGNQGAGEILLRDLVFRVK